MDNLRLFLWAGLAMLLWMNFQTWQADNASAPVVEERTPINEMSALPAAPGSDSASAGDPAVDSALPEVPTAPSESQSTDIKVTAPAVSRDLIHVQTDVLDVEIDPRGGDLVSVKLLAYPFRKDQPDVPVTLLNSNADELFVFHTGLRALDNGPEANHLTMFSAEDREYILQPGSDALSVRLEWPGEGGIAVEKVYRFTRGNYAIDLEQVVTNASESPYRAVSYLQIQRRHQPPERSMFDVDSYSYTGPVVFDGDKYEKIDPEDLPDEPFKQTITGGWFASIQHHFLAAIIPSGTDTSNFQADFDGTTYVLNTIDSEATTISPGGKGTLASRLFVGPKLQSQLADAADGLPLTVDYGIFTILSQPLFWLLQKVYNFIGNWGWTIIIVTLMIKLAFYKLTEASGRSMGKMRKLQPRLKSLQDRYKDDREALSKAMMDLYKREKVNPAAGCLPMLIQIPFFMAFYWVLLESVEMRQAPFMLWITDLSSRDPFFVLPLLMGAAMYFQQKLNPAPPDPMQAKVMQFLPVMFTGMFAFFPAGLVLYWLTNSVLSMAQQWKINKVLGAD
jgi:YidC/Oxa1 family membrane protein insertase